MVAKEHLTVGQELRHLPSGRVYRVMGHGKQRQPGGEWVDAARYVPLTSSPHEKLTVEYYRPVDEFDNFEVMP